MCVVYACVCVVLRVMDLTTVELSFFMRNINLLFPWDLVTRVFPMLRTANMEGAFTSYHSFLVKGSILCG